MFQSASRLSLRAAERFLLVPPLGASFGSVAVAICDISGTGARFRHRSSFDTGSKSALKISLDGGSSPVMLESVVIWSHEESSTPGSFLTGVRTYAQQDICSGLIEQLQLSNRSKRIEEFRSTERFFISPALRGTFHGEEVVIDDLSARGARIVLPRKPLDKETGVLQFSLEGTSIDVGVSGRVVWSELKSFGDVQHYRAGLMITEHPEMMRLAIAQLCELDRASLDAQSLRLKLKIMRARARQLAPAFGAIEASGLPAEQYLLIQGVREELRLNHEEAIHWYRRARLSISDPAIQKIAPQIANHPDALAVWEYLDRSIDPTLVIRAFELPSN